MATRFRFSGLEELPLVTPAFDAAWDDTTIAKRGRCFTFRRSIPFANHEFDDADETDKNILLWQFVSPRMTPGQTILYDPASPPEITAVIRALEFGASNNMNLVWGIRVYNDISATFVKTLLPVTRGTNELPSTTLTSRTFTAGQSAGTYTTILGDRLIIESGGGGNPDAAQDHHFLLNYGDDSKFDLAFADTGTTALCPWLELESTLTFQLDPTVILRGAATLLGGTTLK